MWRGFSEGPFEKVAPILYLLVLLGLSGGLLQAFQNAELQAAERSLATGDLPGAEAALARAARISPANPAILNLQGAIQAQKGDFVAAERLFHAAVSKDPSFEPAWLNLGRLCQMKAADATYLEKGVQAYQTVLRLHPTSAEAHHQLALLLHWKGSFAASLEHLDQLPVADQERRAARALRCADLAALGQRSRAQAVATRLLADPGLEEADILSVLPAIEAHDRATAVRLLSGLLSRNLASPATVEKLAALSEKDGDFAAAKAAYEKLFTLSPRSPAPLLALARLAWQQKDYTATLSYLAHARDLDPKDARTHFLFGLAANEMKAAADARQAIQKAVELDPDNAYYHYALGVLQLQWQEKDASVPHLKRYVEAHPEDPRGHLALGMAYFSLYQDEPAKGQLDGLSKFPAVREGAELLLGRIAARQDDFPAAVAHYKQLLEWNPRSVEGHAEMAELHARHGDFAAARTQAETALSLDPNDYLANNILLRVYRVSKDPRSPEQARRVREIAEKRDKDSFRAVQRSIEVRPY